MCVSMIGTHVQSRMRPRTRTCWLVFTPPSSFPPSLQLFLDAEACKDAIPVHGDAGDEPMTFAQAKLLTRHTPHKFSKDTLRIHTYTHNTCVY